MNLRTPTLLCALALASGGAFAQTTTTPPELQAGTIKSVRGDVQLLSASGTQRPAAPGDVLMPIDRVLTGADAAASIVLRDGTTMVVGPSSRLDVKEFHFDTTTQDGGLLVSLLRGSMRMVTGLIGKKQPDAVRVETQTATIGIRGTDFIVQADAQP
ncbi:MAG: FecR domain-containing protein [Variovorax sp.]